MFHLPNHLPVIAVPTATIIAEQEGKILFFYPTEKHGGKKVLVGGCLELGATYRSTIEEEFDQEVGGKGAKIVMPTLQEWAVKSDPYSDVRTGPKITLGRLVHNTLPEGLSVTEQEMMSNLPAIGLFGCPDMVYSAQFEGEAAPKDGEARLCVLVDPLTIKVTADPKDSEYAVGHELLVVSWVLDTYKIRDLKPTDLADLTALRKELVDWQRKFSDPLASRLACMY